MTESDYQKKNIELTVPEAAYVAGIIDGEGSLQLIPQKARHNNTGIEFLIRVTIANTNKGLIDWLHERIGGYVSVHKQDFRRRALYELHLNPRLTRQLLPQVAPLLVAKKEEVAILLKAASLIHANLKSTESHNRLVLLHYELKELHCRRKQGGKLIVKAI
jgi:hypothetical protein